MVDGLGEERHWQSGGVLEDLLRQDPERWVCFASTVNNIGRGRAAGIGAQHVTLIERAGGECHAK